MIGLLWILWAHYVADFWVQTDGQAREKWHDHGALSAHVLTYTLVMTGAFLVIWRSPLALGLGLANGAAHWLIDFCTSRATHKFFGANRFRQGFQVVGFDQFLHVALLVLSVSILEVERDG